MAAKGILPPSLKVFKTHYQLPVKQQPPLPPSPDIPPSPSQLPSAEPESLGEDQIETEEKIIEARADDTGEKKDKMEPEKNDQDKRGEVPLLRVLRKGVIKSKMESERKVLESQRAGTGVEAPGKLYFLSREMQRIAVDGFMHANGSSELGVVFFLQALSEGDPKYLHNSLLVGKV